jgi:hypothetical protein
MNLLTLSLNRLVHPGKRTCLYFCLSLLINTYVIGSNISGVGLKDTSITLIDKASILPFPTPKGEALGGYDTIGNPPSFSLASTFGISPAEQASALTIDSLNRAVFAIPVIDSIQLADHKYYASGKKDILLICSAPDNSSLNWHNQLSTTIGNRVTCTDIIAGSNGEIFATGLFNGEQLSLEDTVIYRTGTNQDVWLARFDETGNCIWIKNFAATGTPHIALGQDGGLYFTSWSIFNKYDQSGNLIWEAGNPYFDYQKISCAGHFIYVFGRLYNPSNLSAFYFDKAMLLLLKVNEYGNYINFIRLGGNTQSTGTLSSVGSIKAIQNPLSDSTDIFISGVVKSSYILNIFPPRDYNNILYQYTNNIAPGSDQAFLYRFSEEFELRSAWESNYNNPSSTSVTIQLSPLIAFNHSYLYHGSVYIIGTFSEKNEPINLSFTEKRFDGASYTEVSNEYTSAKGGFIFRHDKWAPFGTSAFLAPYSGSLPSLAVALPVQDNLFQWFDPLDRLNVLGITNQTNPLRQLLDFRVDHQEDSVLFSEEMNSFSGISYITNIITDPDCNQYICGTYSGSTKIYDRLLNGTGGSFLAKVDIHGHVIWCDTIFNGSFTRIARDKDGNIWALGSFNSYMATSHGDFLVNESGTDLFLIKYKSIGSIEFCKQYNGTMYSGGYFGSYSLAVDHEGNPVFSSGVFNGKIFFDLTHSVDNNTWNYKYFIAKLNKSGTIQWVVTALNTSSNQSGSEIRSIAFDQNNNVFCTGSYSLGNLSILGNTINTIGIRDMFLFKLSSEGTFSWIKSGGGIEQATDGYSVCVDKKGYSYVFCNGYLKDNPFVFEDSIVTPPKGWIDGILLAKYSPLGKISWLKQFPADDGIVCLYARMDEFDNIYLSGVNITDSLQLENRIILSKTKYDWYLIKCNSDGDPLWLKTFGNLASSYTGMVITRNDEALLYGSLSQTTAYDNISITALNNSTPFILYAGKALKNCDLNADFLQAGTIKCAEQTGEGKFTLSGGSAPYTVQWNDQIIFRNDTLINLLTNKYYSYSIQDLRGCLLVDSLTLNAPPPIILSISSTDSYLDTPTGSAQVTVTGGVSPYSYLWSSGNINDWDSKLPAGAYSVRVTDKNNCEKLGTFRINNLNAPTITLNALTHVSCFGGKDGAIGIDVTDGNPPYTFKWSNGSIKEDVNVLPTGVYEVQVTDHAGLVASASFVVMEPSPLDISLSLRNPDCGDADGSAQVFVEGGISPYKYLWSNGDTLNHTGQLPAGVYSVRVTDKNGCRASQKAVLSEIGAPDISTNSIIYPSCGDSTGAIDLSVTGGSGSYFYSWEGSSFEGELEQLYIQNIPAGEYYFGVTDQLYSCTSIALFQLEDKAPATPEICIVTVDSSSGNIQVAVKDAPLASISSYNIYKESEVFGQYSLIGSISGGVNIYTDSISNSMQRPWKYRVSAVDYCGIESGLSQPHKTIHLTMNIGLGNTVNLIWNRYEGFPVATYDIWRYREGSGWSVIDHVPGDVTSYTDFNATPEDLLYFIEVQHPDGCGINGPKGKTLNSSRSNRSSREKAYVMDLDKNEVDPLMLFPNPNPGQFCVSYTCPASQVVSIRLVDMNGRVCWTSAQTAFAGKNLFEVKTKNLSPGMYSLILSDGTVCQVRKFIIQ